MAAIRKRLRLAQSSPAFLILGEQVDTQSFSWRNLLPVLREMHQLCKSLPRVRPQPSVIVSLQDTSGALAGGLPTRTKYVRLDLM